MSQHFQSENFFHFPREIKYKWTDNLKKRNLKKCLKDGKTFTGKKKFEKFFVRPFMRHLNILGYLGKCIWGKLIKSAAK